MLNAHPVALSLENRMNLTRARKSETAVILSRFLAEGSRFEILPTLLFCKKARGQNGGSFPGALRIASVAIALCCVFAAPAFANDIQITVTALTDQNTGADTIKIPFNISWKNSWNDGSGNYDAAWVFAKYCTSDCQDGGTGTWKHVTLTAIGTNPSGFVQGTGTAINIVVPTDKKGAFIQRSGSGTGTLSTMGVKFVWDYGTDMASDGSRDATVIALGTRVRIFAIEMVYIPAGAFYIGDGNGSTESTYAFHQNGVDNTAVQITGTPKSITVDSNGYDDIDTSPLSINSGGIAGNSSWPTGYNAFYLMKYEISQGQYVRFLNTLTRTQQGNRVASDISGTDVYNTYVMVNSVATPYRTTIQCPLRGNGSGSTRVIFNTGGRDSRAANFISWSDLMAYTDWAGLRPMTELEFEKAARGSAAAVASEYAWGSNSITACATISGTEDGTETCTTTNANCNYYGQTFTGGDAGQGPLRVGIFATGASSRVQAGAGYYGNMDLSGNVSERTVTVGNSTGRAFTGLHGDGALDSNGDANVSFWPSTNAVGSGYRGGGWNATINTMTSYRASAAVTDTARTYPGGGRCARTAP